MTEPSATPATPLQSHGHIIELQHLEDGLASAHCQCGATKADALRVVEKWIVSHRADVGLTRSSQIEEAIDRVSAQPKVVEYRADLPVFPDPLVLQHDSVMTFGVPAGVDGPSMLILMVDEMRWRPILIPPDTVWQLTRVEPVATKPELWVPGMKIQ